MRTFETDENNDFVLINGSLSMITDKKAVSQESKHFAATLRGEMIHAIDEGVPYFREAFSRMPNLSQVEASIRRRILSLDDVESITSLNTFIDGEVLTYTATIQTTYGEVSINGNL